MSYIVTSYGHFDDVNNMADTYRVAYHDQFTSVPLENGQPEGAKAKVKVPRKILHFSDGVLEEYSTDEEDSVDAKPTVVVDPKSLTWLPWCAYYMTSAGKMSLSVAELCGEKLAWLFGITSPKYGYAIEEYKRVQKETEKEKERERILEEQAQVNSAFDVKVVEDDNRGAAPDTINRKEAADKY